MRFRRDDIGIWRSIIWLDMSPSRRYKVAKSGAIGI
jgi:hypothetical protein